jgi:hypothetical protein
MRCDICGKGTGKYGLAGLLVCKTCHDGHKGNKRLIRSSEAWKMAQLTGKMELEAIEREPFHGKRRSSNKCRCGSTLHAYSTDCYRRR